MHRLKWHVIAYSAAVGGATHVIITRITNTRSYIHIYLHAKGPFLNDIVNDNDGAIKWDKNNVSIVRMCVCAVICNVLATDFCWLQCALLLLSIKISKYGYVNIVWYYKCIRGHSVYGAMTH